MKKKEDLKAHLHYLISFIGGFIGVYPILYVAKSFGSAQTANQINMLIDLSNWKIEAFLYRLLGLVVFCIPIVLTTIYFKKHKNKDFKKLAIIIDIIDAVVIYLLPDTTKSLLMVLPNYFAMCFQWCCFSGAYGYAAACIFSTNNTRQFLSSLVEVVINKDASYKTKCKFYGLTLFSFNLGVFLCSILSHFMGRAVSLLAIIPLLYCYYLDTQIKKDQ